MARSYTDDEKRDAVATYVEHGLAEAHRRTGIPKPTLKSWLTPAQEAQVRERSGQKAKQTEAAVAEHVRQMAEQRIVAQREFAASAVYAATQVRTCERGADAQGWATAGGICLDKVRLELGEATARTEVTAAPERSPEVEAELAKVVSLADRRAA